MGVKMNEQQKFFIKDMAAFCLFLFVGFCIGLIWNIKLTEMSCNNFIIEHYYNMSQKECFDRCNEFSGNTLQYNNKELPVFALEKNLDLTNWKMQEINKT